MCKLKYLNVIIVLLDRLAASAYLLLSVPAAARTKTLQVQDEEEGSVYIAIEKRISNSV